MQGIVPGGAGLNLIGPSIPFWDMNALEEEPQEFTPSCVEDEWDKTGAVWPIKSAQCLKKETWSFHMKEQQPFV